MVNVHEVALARSERSLEACDEFEVQRGEFRYCPTDLLGTFTLLMAGQGRCVSSDMMLGDREYAMWQLARAHTLADDQLRSVAVRLFSYFDDPRGWGASLQA
jgi:hypothetical protein